MIAAKDEAFAVVEQVDRTSYEIVSGFAFAHCMAFPDEMGG